MDLFTGFDVLTVTSLKLVVFLFYLCSNCFQAAIWIVGKPHFSAGKMANETNKVLHMFCFLLFANACNLITPNSNLCMGSSCRIAFLKWQVKSYGVTAGTRGSRRQFCLQEDDDDALISHSEEGGKQTLNIKSRSLFDSVTRRVTGCKYLTLTLWNAVKI